MRCRNYRCDTTHVHLHGWACTAGCSACKGGQAENHNTNKEIASEDND